MICTGPWMLMGSSDPWHGQRGSAGWLSPSVNDSDAGGVWSLPREGYISRDHGHVDYQVTEFVICALLEVA